MKRPKNVESGFPRSKLGRDVDTSQRARIARLAAKGRRFEVRIRKVLEEARASSGGRITFKCKPKIRLQNKEVLEPDFSLRIRRPHEVRHLLIECQNRKRSKKDILYKIQHIRTKHRSKTFIFVHGQKLGSELVRALKAEGVVNLSFERFREYLHDEGILSCQSWTIASRSMPRPAEIDSRKLALVSKTQTVFYSHPDAKSQLDDLLENESPVLEKNPDSDHMNSLRLLFGTASKPKSS